MCGLFIQLGAREKKLRKQLIDNLITNIQTTDTLNKQHPNPDVKAKLLKLRLVLRSLLIENYDKFHKRTKMHFYISDNKAGKLLASQIKGCRTKTHIPCLIHPVTKEKLLNPQDIADAFNTYYESLYNLNTDPP